MKKKILFFAAILIAVVMQGKADEPTIDGIYVTYPNSAYAYKLTSVPTVTYETENGKTYAVITPTPADAEEGIVKMELSDGKEVVITYAHYVPTGINDVNNDRVTITERNGQKYIQGGKLIIVDKDGKKFDINGCQILDEQF